MNRQIEKSLCLVAAVLIVVAASGCESTNPRANGAGNFDQGNYQGSTSRNGNQDPASQIGVAYVAPSPRVDTLELESFPSAVNLDSIPGPDGVHLRLRMYDLANRSKPRTVILNRGHIEFILFEGKVLGADLGTAEPTHVWRYSASALARYRQRVLVGSQYELRLNWRDNPPLTKSITLVARMVRPGRSPLYARPVLISVSGV
jgi:hypothetical protein